MLKFILDSLEGVPDALHPYYEKNGDGKFALRVEGAKTQGDVDRVQAALVKERGDHKATKDKLTASDAKAGKWGDLEFDDVAARLEEHETLKAAAGTPGTDLAKIEAQVNERVEQKLKTINKGHDRKVQELTEKLTASDKKASELDGQITARTIKDEIRSSAQAAKVNPEMLDDIVDLIRGKFVVQDGKVVNEDGLDVNAFINDRKKDKGYWWAPAQGAGARPGNGAAGGKNPFSHTDWNMTEQGKLLGTDRPEAERLATAAGTKIGGGRPPAPKAAA